MKTSFRELLILAWKASLSCKESWVFGLLIAFAILKENALLDVFGEAASFDGGLASLLEQFSSLPSLIGVIAGIAIVRIFGKSNLVAVLDAAVKKTQTERLVFPQMMNNFFRAALFQVVAVLLLVCVLAVLALPAWLASVYNPEALSSVMILSILTALIILSAFFFIVEFAFFYFFLARIGLWAALGNGLMLFSRNIGRSIAFGIFYLGLLIAFTFCLNLVMLTIVMFSQKTGMAWVETSASFLGSLFFIGWFSIIEQAMRLLFFKDLATPKEKEEELVVSAGVPEPPLA